MCGGTDFNFGKCPHCGASNDFQFGPLTCKSCGKIVPSGAWWGAAPVTKLDRWVAVAVRVLAIVMAAAFFVVLAYFLFGR